jgi:hypothetical protein
VSGQGGEGGGDDMGGDGAGSAANAAFVGGRGFAEGRQEVGGRGVSCRRDMSCGPTLWMVLQRGSETLYFLGQMKRNREHDAVRNRSRKIKSRR